MKEPWTSLQLIDETTLCATSNKDDTEATNREHNTVNRVPWGKIWKKLEKFWRSKDWSQWHFKIKTWDACYQMKEKKDQ